MQIHKLVQNKIKEEKLMYVVIYNKKSLEIIAKPTITNLEEFKGSPSLFYPDWDAEKHTWNETEYQNPILENGKLRESTKEELYKVGKYSLSSNEIIENGKIKTVELSEFEYIDNNKIKLNRDKKIENIKEKLNALKVQHSEKEFIFKEKYKQKNRELDKNNLGNITTMLLATKQTDFKNWKFKGLDGKDIYVDLTIQDMLLIAKMMQEQTTKAMMTETALKVKIEALSDEELKNFDSEKEFEKEWDK